MLRKCSGRFGAQVLCVLSEDLSTTAFTCVLSITVMKKKAAFFSSQGTVKVDVEHFTTFVREVWGIV
jgi:hypothetical protein